MSIGVAIIGGGIFARESHLPALDASQKLTLKAIYSRSMKSAQSLDSTSASPDFYSDDAGPGRSLEDLLARSDVHAVIIALPILVQAEFIRKALSAGKHVLSEKPIAESVSVARELIAWCQSRIDSSKTFWSVAENFRFMSTYQAAAEVRATQGRALTFRLQMQSLVTGGKWYDTEWRKTPGYQGGFLLDGGIHYIAGIRMLLGSYDPIVSVSANTAQLQSHLPPVDTIEGIAKTRSGAVGSISISFGTTAKGRDCFVASTGGTVGVGFDEILVNGQSQEVIAENAGVPAEIDAWAQAIIAGKPDHRQLPEEALADLILLEALLKSGEQGGVPISIEHHM